MSQQAEWPPPPPQSSGSSRTTLWVIIAVVAALVVGGGLTTVLLTSEVSRSGKTANSALDRFAAERDTVLRDAEKAGITLNTIDYRHVDADLDKWASVSTGALHEEITRSRKQSKDAIVEAKSATEAEVLSSAVSELNRDSGKATVLAAMLVHVRAGDAQPSEKRMRIEISMARTKIGWRADGIAQVPYHQ